jgi:hypothetical protein
MRRHQVEFPLKSIGHFRTFLYSCWGRPYRSKMLDIKYYELRLKMDIASVESGGLHEASTSPRTEAQLELSISGFRLTIPNPQIYLYYQLQTCKFELLYSNTA